MLDPTCLLACDVGYTGREKEKEKEKRGGGGGSKYLGQIPKKPRQIIESCLRIVPAFNTLVK